MAVEKAAFVTCNSLRLLEVFNRHFKLKKEGACKKKGGKKSGHRRGRRQEEEDKKDRNKQRYIKRTHTKQIKEIRLLASSQIFAFPLKSVRVAAKSIIGRQKHANQGTQRVKQLSEVLRSDTLMYANRNHK